MLAFQLLGLCAREDRAGGRLRVARPHPPDVCQGSPRARGAGHRVLLGAGEAGDAQPDLTPYLSPAATALPLLCHCSATESRPRPCQVFRRHICDRVAANLHSNIVKCFSRGSVERRCASSRARRARSGRPTAMAPRMHMLILRSMWRSARPKAHRNIIDSEYGISSAVRDCCRAAGPTCNSCAQLSPQNRTLWTESFLSICSTFSACRTALRTSM